MGRSELAHQRELLRIYQRNLKFLQKQFNSYGPHDYIPVVLLNQLEDTQAQVDRTQAIIDQLEKSSGT
jgi:hypothetical protein